MMAINTNQSADVSKVGFRVSIGIFFGFAIASVLARIGYRIHAGRRLYLDDYIVLLGSMSLCAAIGITYHETEFGFLVQALQKDPSLLSQISVDQITKLFNTKYSILHAFFALTWTAIYAVKISFLVFFKKLIQGVTKIQTYFWIVGVITSVSWVFVVVEPLIICQHPNQNFAKCMDPSLYQISVSMSWLTNSLDVFTDILIVSIPLIILRRSKIKTRQKFALSFFLCLSTVMAAFAITRISRISDPDGINMVWQVLWQALEGCIALLMASVTAFRSIFVSQGIRERERKRRAASYSWIQRAKQRKAASKEKDLLSSSTDRQQQLPSIPQATFTKMEKYIQEHAHETQDHHGSSTDGGSTTLDPETRFSSSADENSLTMKNSRHQDQSMC